MRIRLADAQLYALGQRVTSGGGASLERAAALAIFLASDVSGALSGRLISAVTDFYPADADPAHYVSLMP